MLQATEGADSRVYMADQERRIDDLSNRALKAERRVVELEAQKAIDDEVIAAQNRRLQQRRSA